MRWRSPRAAASVVRRGASAIPAAFDSVVLNALKETEQALAVYGTALANRQSLAEAQDKIHGSFDIAHDQFLAGSLSNLDLLTTEQSLVALDAAVASADATLVQDQIAVFKARVRGASVQLQVKQCCTATSQNGDSGSFSGTEMADRR